MQIFVGIIAGVLVVMIIAYISIYNNLIKVKNWVEEALAQIDVQLKRRNDLIPNLVETVKGYAKHEQETFEKVIAMRNQLMAIPDNEVEKQMEVSNQLTDALKSIFALSENYPDLKANQNFLNLQEELTNTENKIAYSRQLYNSTVKDYNITLETFPSNIVAGLHHFNKKVMLETPEEEKAVPKIQF